MTANITARPDTANVALFERRTYQFIGLYRYFAFAMAVLTEAVWPRLRGEVATDNFFFILGLIALLTIFKIIWPRYDVWRMDPAIVAGGETVVILIAVIWDGGLHSGLLLYSLTPIIANALLYEVKLPLFLAILPGSAMLVSHLLLPRWWPSLGYLLTGNYLVIFVLYVAVTFLIVLIPLRVNVTVLRRLDEQTVSRERRKLSWEIHDNLAQSLGYLCLQLSRSREKLASGDHGQSMAIIEETANDAREAYNQTREAIDFLRLQQSGGSFLAALPDYVSDFGRHSGINARADIPPHSLRLPRDTELQLLGIVQGALSNVRRHAGASNVRVTLTIENSLLKLVVRDDGSGFSPGSADTGRQGHGLDIMRERAAAIGAAISIDGKPGQGTQVLISLPLKGRRGQQK